MDLRTGYVSSSAPTEATDAVPTLIERARHLPDARERLLYLSDLAVRAARRAERSAALAALALAEIRRFELWREAPDRHYESFSDWLEEWSRDNGLSRRQFYHWTTSALVAQSLGLSREQIATQNMTKLRYLVQRINYDARTGEVLDPSPGQLSRERAVALLEDIQPLSVSEAITRIHEEAGHHHIYFRASTESSVLESQPVCQIRDLAVIDVDGSEHLICRATPWIPAALAQRFLRRLGIDG